MDLVLLRRHRRWILLAGAGAATAYFGYRLHHHPAVARRRRNLLKLLDALLSLSSAAETLSLLSADLNRFLKSDSDDIPASLTQLSKLAASPHFSASLSTAAQALTVGFLRGYRAATPDSNPNSNSNTTAFVDKLVSPEGAGFVSVISGSFARELVLAYYSASVDRKEEGEPGWVKAVTGEKGRALIGECVQRFVTTAVTVFLDKTMDINTYDQVFAGLTNPKHGKDMKDVLVTVCNGAVETLVKTSHQVMSSGASSQSKVEESGGWVDQVTSTLAVPGNQRFILDVTGRVTFETVRSFLQFLLWKMQDGATRSVGVVREEVVGRGLEVMRYISAKTMVIITVCLALCMRVLRGTRVLLPA